MPRIRSRDVIINLKKETEDYMTGDRNTTKGRTQGEVLHKKTFDDSVYEQEQFDTHIEKTIPLPTELLERNLTPEQWTKIADDLVDSLELKDKYGEGNVASYIHFRDERSGRTFNKNLHIHIHYVDRQLESRDTILYQKNYKPHSFNLLNGNKIKSRDYRENLIHHFKIDDDTSVLNFDLVPPKLLEEFNELTSNGRKKNYTDVEKVIVEGKKNLIIAYAQSESVEKKVWGNRVECVHRDNTKLKKETKAQRQSMANVLNKVIEEYGLEKTIEKHGYYNSNTLQQEQEAAAKKKEEAVEKREKKVDKKTFERQLELQLQKIRVIENTTGKTIIIPEKLESRYNRQDLDYGYDKKLKNATEILINNLKDKDMSAHNLKRYSRVIKANNEIIGKEWDKMVTKLDDTKKQNEIDQEYNRQIKSQYEKYLQQTNTLDSLEKLKESQKIVVEAPKLITSENIEFITNCYIDQHRGKVSKNKTKHKIDDYIKKSSFEIGISEINKLSKEAKDILESQNRAKKLENKKLLEQSQLEQTKQKNMVAFEQIYYDMFINGNSDIALKQAEESIDLIIEENKIEVSENELNKVYELAELRYEKYLEENEVKESKEVKYTSPTIVVEPTKSTKKVVEEKIVNKTKPIFEEVKPKSKIKGLIKTVGSSPQYYAGFSGRRVSLSDEIVKNMKRKSENIQERGYPWLIDPWEVNIFEDEYTR